MGVRQAPLEGLDVEAVDAALARLQDVGAARARDQSEPEVQRPRGGRRGEIE